MRKTAVLKKGKRNPIVDMARMLFIFAIFIDHTNNLLQPNEQAPLYMIYGFLGVEFFFILSGYLMAAKARRVYQDAPLSADELSNETMRFLWRKYASVFPFFFIAYCVAMVLMNLGEESYRIVAHVIRSLPTIFWLQMAGYGDYQPLYNSWYLSAMLLSMLLLYPLLLRYKKTFVFTAAPILVLACYGYCFTKNGNLAVIEPIKGAFIFPGLLRGIAGASLGCICYEATSQISSMQLSRLGTILLTITSPLAFSAAFLIMFTQHYFRPDFLVICLSAIGITTAFCQQNLLAYIPGSYAWIGKLSLCFYVSDPVSRLITERLLPEAGRDKRIIPAIIICFLLSGIIWVTGISLQRATHRVCRLIASQCCEKGKP